MSPSSGGRLRFKAVVCWVAGGEGVGMGQQADGQGWLYSVVNPLPRAHFSEAWSFCCLYASEGLEICGNFSNGACAALRNEAASGWFVVRHHTSFAVARTVVVAVRAGRTVCPPGPSGTSVISRVPMSSLSCTFRRLFALMKTWTAVPRGHCRLDSVLQEQFFPRRYFQ